MIWRLDERRADYLLGIEREGVWGKGGDEPVPHPAQGHGQPKMHGECRMIPVRPKEGVRPKGVREEGGVRKGEGGI